MKKCFIIIAMACAVCIDAAAAKPKASAPPQPEIQSQWNGAKVAFLGDSITDESQLRFQEIYWNKLAAILGIQPYCYGISGDQTAQIIDQAHRLMDEHGQDVDAIMIFIGTNDFNGSIPPGDWYREEEACVNKDGRMTVLKHRVPVMEGNSVRAQINVFMSYLKHNYPTKQIILLTPIHRAYLNCQEDNVQPDENFANLLGLYYDEYVEIIKETSQVWAVPVIDLGAVCGLYPLEPEFAQYFRESERKFDHTAAEAAAAPAGTAASLERHDLVHPNTKGHLRMAYSLAYQLLSFPSRF